MRQSSRSGPRRSLLWSRIASECLAGALLAATSAAAAPQPAPAVREQPTQRAANSPRASQPPIVINAGFSRVDYNTNTVLFRNIVVSQGGTRLTAERANATGVGFANSQWTFEERVVIELEPRGTLHCDRAVVTFRDNRITVATATGEPAQFEQRRTASQRAARGRANRIVYDAREDTVRLSGDARFSDARGLEVSGPLLVYDIRNERLQAASPGERRGVHITVNPGAVSEKGQPSPGREPRR